MTHLLNLLGIVGFFALLTGVYLEFGLAVSLMSGGVMLLTFALLALRANGGRHA
ncbi:hypothetical protein [Vibrio sp. H11]|uniref:hypothetical protein n=1 Tax=Vibrio sp. H11 TaxID=2565928 RepID=UPI001455EDC1|nr:hypothetical protein [Vibrio sp. H11]